MDVESHDFIIPKKEIGPGPEDIPIWEKSEGYRDLLGFLQAMCDAVKGKKTTAEVPMSEILTRLLAMLDKLDSYIEEFPPSEQAQRFGNKSFREWFNKMNENSCSLVGEMMGEKYQKAAEEIATYLTESFGNSTRIDYGTGHELAFAAFLLCLYKISALTEADAPGVVLKVFNRYIKLVRRLQITYRMEPAGSQGVWSLDDHQFIVYLFGSAQLQGHQRILPKSFVKPEIFENFAKDYMFLDAVKHICTVKSGMFAEHSNQLWNISGVPNWDKVNSGLFKMYKAEVLAKFPVIQHFLFGSLISIKPAS